MLFAFAIEACSNFAFVFPTRFGYCFMSGLAKGSWGRKCSTIPPVLVLAVHRLYQLAGSLDIECYVKVIDWYVVGPPMCAFQHNSSTNVV